MNPIFQAAWEVERFMRDRGWMFCFIGGLAVQRWGKPRFTADADLTLMTGFGEEARYVETILVGSRVDPEGTRALGRVEERSGDSEPVAETF